MHVIFVFNIHLENYVSLMLLYLKIFLNTEIIASSKCADSFMVIREHLKESKSVKTGAQN